MGKRARKQPGPPRLGTRRVPSGLPPMLTLACDRPEGILYVEWAETAPGAIDAWRRAEQYLFDGARRESEMRADLRFYAAVYGRVAPTRAVLALDNMVAEGCMLVRWPDAPKPATIPTDVPGRSDEESREGQHRLHAGGFGRLDDEYVFCFNLPRSVPELLFASGFVSADYVAVPPPRPVPVR